MLPLGILNASMKNVRRKRNSSTDTAKIFAHSHRKETGPAPRLTLRSAPTRCSAVIARAGVGVGEDPAGSLMLIRRRNDSWFSYAAVDQPQRDETRDVAVYLTRRPSPSGINGREETDARMRRYPNSVRCPKIVVDLCSLQRPGEIDVANLRLRVELVYLPSPLAMAVAGLFYAPERQMCLGAYRRRVHI